MPDEGSVTPDSEREWLEGLRYEDKFTDDEDKGVADPRLDRLNAVVVLIHWLYRRKRDRAI